MGGDMGYVVKAREELPLLDLFPMATHEEREIAAEGEGVGAIVPSESPATMATPAHTDRMKTVLVDKARLCCSLCSDALNRPIYQCTVGHLVCCRCRFKCKGDGCRTCAVRGVASPYTICSGLGYFLGGFQVPCPNHEYGCETYSPYYEAADHAAACAHAPCRCAEQGCGFAAPPPALLAHLAAAHSWPTHEVPGYGKPLALRIPAAAAHHRLLTVTAEDDDAALALSPGTRARGVFVLSVRPRGAGCAVSVSCVRASAEAGPQYSCNLWARGPAPPGGVEPRLGMETDVGSCAAPGGAGVEEGLWLHVGPKTMHGDGSCREMQLIVLIDKL
ncbi:hypothetical protein PR202_gb26594 [Eleusine coracana subsp. coracana]|uniref:SIAH-type domain-containing protein n=1 Tax=Eleusine coracana subsp. coracana TaxID=191504 RepID=A0AAV5FT16_ELECO|nr:hypothetical protein QOZ80_1BG0056630 [Eleusine coracana subsp. coracana]GJN37620.1 hypothetical protein PR202_gb26594 [Eleusine coracana subsp. coracana]